MLSAANEKGLKVYYLPSDQVNILDKSDDLFDAIIVTLPVHKQEKIAPFKFTGEQNQVKFLEPALRWIDVCLNHLEKHGAILVYGLPRWLPYVAEFLYQRMVFKYWIVVRNPEFIGGSTLMQPYHEGILLFVKDRSKFTINKVRYPHIYCSQCGDYLADWGGKKHLRPEFGPIISDVWDDRDDFFDQKHGIAPATLDRLLQLTCKDNSKVLLAMFDKMPYEGIKPYSPEGVSKEISDVSDRPIYFTDLSEEIFTLANPTPDTQLFRKDEIYIGDSIEVMETWISDPSARFDLIFADPPYNLEKNYGKLEDNLKEQEYISWCEKWLELCARLLKPYGSLYVLNLPKWSFFHAKFLNTRLWFQRWIAWDALSDPRGNIMPAHYGLLLYTNHPTKFTYNSISQIPKMDQCLRSKCITNRSPQAPREELSDIWYDIHRIKHKRYRDEHPCQLPTKLLERVIQLSSNSGDTVLDPFMGTGTTAIVSKKFGRHYVGIDIDPQYRAIAQSKLDLIGTAENGFFHQDDAPNKAVTKQLTLFIE